MKILSNKEYERIINKKPQFYTYYMKDPYQAKKIEQLEIQNIRLEIESDKKDKEIERLNNKEEQLIRRLEDLIIVGEQVENEWAVDICKMIIEELKGSDKE